MTPHRVQDHTSEDAGVGGTGRSNLKFAKKQVVRSLIERVFFYCKKKHTHLDNKVGGKRGGEVNMDACWYGRRIV